MIYKILVILTIIEVLNGRVIRPLVATDTVYIYRNVFSIKEHMFANYEKKPPSLIPIYTKSLGYSRRMNDFISGAGLAIS